MNYIHPEKLFFCDYSSLKRVQVRNRTRQQEQIDQQQEEISYYNRIRTENLERELEQARVRARMQEEQLRRFRQQQLAFAGRANNLGRHLVMVKSSLESVKVLQSRGFHLEIERKRVRVRVFWENREREKHRD